jgi:undecaprenyl-diphosphatase
MLPVRVSSRWQKWWGRPGWERFVHVVAAVTFLVALGGFVALARAVSHGGQFRLENEIMRALRRDGAPLGPEWVSSAVRDLTALGSSVVLVLVTLLILGFVLLRRHFRIAALLTASVAGGAIINLVLKNAFDRARPDEALRLVAVHSSSFPSGHAMAASIFYLTTGALLARMAKRRREKLYAVAASMLFTGLVGFSRVYLGVHYPTDVLAGWAAGTAWALVCWFVADWLGRRGALRKETGEVATA